MVGMAEGLGKAAMTPGEGRTVGGRHRQGSYLTEIGAYELLTAGEEVALARAISRGNEAVERLREGERDERRELEAAAEEGRRAQERFVRSNLRLVVSVARRYARGRMEMLDLIRLLMGRVHGEGGRRRATSSALQRYAAL